MLTENDDCCGPMAAAFLRDYSVTMEVVSAGRNPEQNIDSLAVEVMHECLIELDDYKPRDAKSIDASAFDAVYDCPEIDAPKTMDAYRAMRDFIKNEAYLFFKTSFNLKPPTS